jgi:hypothetical protein
VTRGGAVEPLPELNPAISVEEVSINWAGDSYAVFFTDPATPLFFPAAVNIILLRTDGSTRAPATVVLRSEGVASFASASANGGELLFVTWSDVADGAVHTLSFGTFHLRDSTLVAAPPIPPVFQPGQPPLDVSMATNGTDAFAVWFEQDNGDYRVQRFGNGFAFGPSAIVAAAPQELADTALTWDGLQYVVFFKAEDESLQAVRYAADGTRLDLTPLGLTPPVVDDVSAAAPLSLPDGSFVAWVGDDGDDTGQQVFGDFLTRTGVFGPPPGEQTLSVSFADRSDATVVWVGDHYLAAWHDATNFTRAAIGRFTIEGQPLDGTGIIVSSGDVAAPPVLATNGRTAVVAWIDTNGVAAAFVDGGTVRPLFEDFAGGIPSVNWNGQQYVVVWRSPQGQLMGIRVSGTGTFIDNQPVTIAPVTGQPIIGWTGNSYVVAFRDPEGCFLPCNPSILWAQLVSPALNPIGSRIQLSETLAGLPVIASGPAGALVVWPRTAGTTTTLRGARVVNGAVLDPLNGFQIGEATYATAYAGPNGWGVVSGPFHWSVSANGTVAPRVTLFPFVPLGARSLVVLGGPEPLVVYRREPVGSEQMMQSVARFFISPTRGRAVRH